MPTFTKDGVAFNYVDKGAGNPLVLLHGVGARLESWDDVVAQLGGRRRVIRSDMRGHGRSARVTGPYSLAGLADDVIALTDHLGLERFSLVGFSLGGIIAQRLAIDHGDRIKALALVSAVAGRTAEEQARVNERKDILRREGPLTHLANSVERWFTPAFIAANPDKIEARRRDALQNDPDCYLAAYEVLADSDLVDELDQIRMPTLVMTGENDIGSSARMSEVMHRKIRGSEIEILPGLKHSILMEAPALVADRLGRFLNKHDPA